MQKKLFAHPLIKRPDIDAPDDSKIREVFDLEKILNDIANVLNCEHELYEQLLEMSKVKTHFIVEGKVTDLEKMVKVEQTFLLELAKLEGTREKLIDDLAVKIGCKPEEVTLSSLITTAAQNQKAMLEGLHSKITDTMKQVTETNELNSKLIKNSLDYINFTMGILTSSGTEDNNYDTKASIKTPKSRSLFDIKA